MIRCLQHHHNEIPEKWCVYARSKEQYEYLQRRYYILWIHNFRLMLLYVIVTISLPQTTTAPSVFQSFYSHNLCIVSHTSSFIHLQQILSCRFFDCFVFFCSRFLVYSLNDVLSQLTLGFPLRYTIFRCVSSSGIGFHA